MNTNEHKQTEKQRYMHALNKMRAAGITKQELLEIVMPQTVVLLDECDNIHEFALAAGLMPDTPDFYERIEDEATAFIRNFKKLKQ